MRYGDTSWALKISIHAPHTRSDPPMGRFTLLSPEFQSTLLIRGATSRAFFLDTAIAFQSTLLIRGATSPRRSSRSRSWISIHAPHTRSDSLISMTKREASLFQSTLLIRGATCTANGITIASHFNPRSSYEERRLPLRAHEGNGRISIHAPHTRSDCGAPLSARSAIPFQSTLLIRGATLGTGV